MVIPPLIGNPYNGYIGPYHWVDDHPLLYGNNGSLDPGTHQIFSSITEVMILPEFPTVMIFPQILPFAGWQRHNHPSWRLASLPRD